MKSLIAFFILFTATLSHSQQRIDGSFPFQTDPAKKYSIYIPSTYEAGTPNQMMLGLHPFNTSRWNAQSWCDTLITFAENNNLLLVCPDGGIDGRVDDPIDTAFTTTILDSMMHWYTVDASKVYAMGFSWGGLTTYTYGLNNVEKFAGFMPIGAAINGLSPLNNVIANAEGKPFYLVHGSQDSPSIRFHPLRDGLIDNGACVETNLMSGVGHTIDFPNRNEILTTAFEWLQDNECTISNIKEATKSKTNIFPNPAHTNEVIHLSKEAKKISYRLFDINAKVISEGTENTIIIKESGIYFITTNHDGKSATEKVIVLD